MAHASASIRFDVPPRALTRSVTGTSAILSTLATDSGDPSSLTYTWAATRVPGGAPEPIFAPNGTSAAGRTTVVFGMAGSYKFTVTAGDASGRKAARAFNVKVQSTLRSITVYPPEWDLAQGDSEPFGAWAFDQFGRRLPLQRHVRWTATAGVVSKTGMYTAPLSDVTVVVTASEGQIHGNADVQIVTPGAPLITIPAQVWRQYVGTAILDACGSEDGSNADLTYDWTLTSEPAGAETPTIVDYSSDASSVAVIPRQPGTYAFTVTVTNASGLSACSSVDVTFNQVFYQIAITPGNPGTLHKGSTQQYQAVAEDQFGEPMPCQPTFTWTTKSGTITPDGLFTAGVYGSDSVTATAGSVSQSAYAFVSPRLWIASAASATPGDIVGTTTTLSALAGDDDNGQYVFYHWARPPCPVARRTPVFGLMAKARQTSPSTRPAPIRSRSTWATAPGSMKCTPRAASSSPLARHSRRSA